jgi:hypothetical protein
MRPGQGFISVLLHTSSPLMKINFGPLPESAHCPSPHSGERPNSQIEHSPVSSVLSSMGIEM